MGLGRLTPVFFSITWATLPIVVAIIAIIVIIARMWIDSAERYLYTGIFHPSVIVFFKHILGVIACEGCSCTSEAQFSE